MIGRRIDTLTTLVIHCSATPNGRWTTAEQIDDWHRARGFRRVHDIAPRHEPHLRAIGYHSVIGVDGTLWNGRALLERGAHAAGHNAKSVGICLIGTDRYSPAQWATLRTHVCALLATLAEAKRASTGGPRLQRPLTPADAIGLLDGAALRVVGHRDLSPDRNGDGKVTRAEWTKTCPGFDVAGWLQSAMQPLDAHLLAVDPVAAGRR